MASSVCSEKVTLGLVGSGLALAAYRAGYLERRGALTNHRLVGGRAAGREVELVARCRRYGKLRRGNS